MERPLSRREFLRLAGLATLDGILASCEQPKEFVYNQKDRLGNIELYLPGGESHPEKGRFIQNINPEVLENIGIAGSSVVRPTLRARILYEKGPQVLLIQFVISRSEDKEPKDKLSIDIVDDSDSQEPHQFTARWSNWKITDATWDGMTIPKPPTA